MNDDDARPASCYRKERTWYGLPAEILVTETHVHRVQIPGVTLPHPGLVNWIVRRGLSVPDRLELTALHEFGHLQTLPVPLLHLAALLWPRRGESPYPRWLRFLAGLLSHQAAWEMAAEGYVAARDARAVRVPRPRQDQVLYALFWGGMALFSLWSTWFVLKRKEV